MKLDSTTPANRIVGRRARLGVRAALALLAAASLSSPSHAYEIVWWTIDGGGGTSAAPGSYSISGTIGQFDAGPPAPMAGGVWGLAGGFWCGGMTVTTDVGDDAEGSDPGTGAPPSAVFRAYPGSPNPFRATATLSFDLPSPQPVRLAIYDVSGRLCRTLNDGALPAGHHDLAWDGRDAAGQTVATGIYFVTLETPAGSHREKLVKVR
ncbi:MAG: FlgD immunoglobulin-like domain containing protein [Candidatus Eisenbacteria bacterium]